MLRYLWFAILLTLAFLIGCQPEDNGEDEVISDTVIEGEIITDADTVDEGELVTFTVPESTDAAADTATADGYRVQIFAGASEENAQRLALEAESVLSIPAYVLYTDGFWKVRVGNCGTRAEAETLRNRARNAGYADCWIAADTIER